MEKLSTKQVATELKAACAVLSAVCDGARKQDFLGFNASDTGFGKSISLVPADQWDADTCREVRAMLAKYRGQLADHGIDYDSLPSIPGTSSRSRKVVAQSLKERAVREEIRTAAPAVAEGLARANGLFYLFIEGECASLISPRNQALIDQLRALPRADRRWNPTAMCWQVRTTQAAALLDVIDVFRFLVSDADLALLKKLAAKPVEAPKPANRPVNVWIDGDRIMTKTPYNADVVRWMKSVQGRRWDGTRKLNTFPMTIDAVESLLEMADQYDWHMTDDVRETLENVGKVQAAKVEASRAVDADLEIPGFAEGLAPYPFQKAGIRYALETDRCFVADEMGLGKSLQAMCTVHLKDAYPALIICPKAVRRQWVNEIAKFLPGQTAIEATAKTKSIVGYDFVVINYDIVKKMTPVLQEVDYQAVVLDESHYIKNHKTQRSQAVNELAKGVKVRMCLTGTPVLNRPIELAAQLMFLDRLNDFGGFWDFAKRYCAAHQGSFGWDMTGASNLEELATKLRASCFIRREKSEVVKELPALQRTIVPIEIRQRKYYNQAVEGFRAEARELRKALKDPMHPDYKRAQAAAVTLIGRLRHATTEYKRESTISWVKNFLDSDGKLVLFAHHQDEQKALCEALSNYNPAKITGAQGDKKRNAEIDKFWNDDSCRVIVCSMKAANMGLNLQVASKVAFTEFAWHAAEMDQAEARVHRIGSDAESINSYWLVAADSFDEDLVSLIEAKREIQDTVNKGDEDVEKSMIVNMLTALIGEEK